MMDWFDQLYRHPQLPAGYNADDIDGDEVDGAGTNWSIVPAYVETFMPLEVIIITKEMLAVFDGCPDYVVPPVDNVIVFPCEEKTVAVPADFQDYFPASPNNVITFPREQRTQAMRKRR